MNGIDGMLSQVMSAVNGNGIPYPSKPALALGSIYDNHELMGPPLVEISVSTDNGKGGGHYELLVNGVIHSKLLNSYWFVYGIIYETLLTGEAEDIQVLAFRWFQNRAYIAPFRLGSCNYLECEMLTISEIKCIIPSIPAIEGYRWIN